VGPSAAQSPALVARIEEKKAELAHLKELKELSAAVANQMESLEQKLSTLSDGTEGTWNALMMRCKARPDALSQPSRQSWGTGIMSYAQSTWHRVSRIQCFQHL
jgi:hypothetical protein